MNRNRFSRPTALAAAAFGALLGGFGSIDVAPSAPGGPAGVQLAFGAPTAEAHHIGVVRRTARCVTRRNVARAGYRAHVNGCPYVAPYYACGGFYYRPVLHNGATVYVRVEN